LYSLCNLSFGAWDADLRHYLKLFPGPKSDPAALMRGMPQIDCLG
jgi:hypothetical protein